MKDILNFDVQRSCYACVYSDETNVKDDLLYCTIRKKHYPVEHKCRKFSVNITKISARRKRLPKYINADDFSIY